MLDRGTKIYAAVLAVLVVMAIVAVFYQPEEVRDLNRLLAADAQLSAYPYAFRVLRVENGVAVMSTPRSPEVPVQHKLGAIHPELQRRGSDDPEFQAAQQVLADHQTHASELVRSEPGILSVRWELDMAWLREHGIQIP